MSDVKNKTNEQDAVIVDHEYDGIQEFNNPAPFWWQLFFYLSIAFGIGYFMYYEVLGGPTSSQELARQMEVIQQAQKKSAGEGPGETDFVAAGQSPERLANGQQAFIGKCASCHANDGGGLIGPNLTDDFWIHGKGDLAGIYQVVKEGVLDKGMPPWAAILTRDEMIDVVAYVKSLRGKPVAKAKAPDGTRIE